VKKVVKVGKVAGVACVSTTWSTVKGSGAVPCLGLNGGEGAFVEFVPSL